MTTAITGEIRPSIPVATGKAVSKFRGKLTGTGLKLAASIGWSVAKDAPWYINVQEYGARDHPLYGGASIRTRKKQFYYQKAKASGVDIRSGAGVHVKIGKHGEWRTIAIHPGLPALGFMKSGAERAQPLIDSVMGPANEAVARELVVP